LDTVVVQAAIGHRGRAWDGVVEAVQQSALSAQTSGRVASVAADIDDQVAADAVLIRLSVVEQQAAVDTARAQVRAAKAAEMEAEATHARYVALDAKHFVSRLQLDQVRAARDAAVAAHDAARAQRAQASQQVDYTVVRAPFAGVIAARLVEPGESVAPGQPLMSIYSPDAMRIEVRVPQSEAAAIRAVNQAMIVLADGREIEATSVIVFPAADPATHSVSVRVTLPELTEAPRPGVTAQVVFPIGGDRPAVFVPRDALVQRGELSGVYVLDDARLALRQLRLGRVRGDDVEVLSGLNNGDQVATDPVAALQALVAQRRSLAADHE
jgi:RND family efflux transporter MFP subunit